MRYIKKFNENVDYDEIASICKTYNITGWKINEDGLVDVNGDVNLGVMKNGRIPLNFGIVSGNFYTSVCELTSLEGCPVKVGGNFNCSRNKLKSLKGSPKYVGGNFSCSGNDITSFEYGPEYIGGNLDFSMNDINSFENIAKTIGGYIDGSYNKFKSLVGCPKKIYGKFDMISNELESLYGCAEWVDGYFNCSFNNLTTIEHCPKYIQSFFKCSNNADLYTFKGMSDVTVIGDFGCSGTKIIEIYKLFRDKKYLELFDFYDPIEPPTKDGGKPILHLDILNEFLEEIGNKKVTNNNFNNYECV